MICLAGRVVLWDLRGWLSEALCPLGPSLSGKQPPLEDTEPWAPLCCRGHMQHTVLVEPGRAATWLSHRTLREAAFTSHTSLSTGLCVTSGDAMRSLKNAQGKPAQIPDRQNSQRRDTGCGLKTLSFGVVCYLAITEQERDVLL